MVDINTSEIGKIFMGRSRRHLISWLLIALCVVVVMNPFAPGVIRSAYLAHAFTGKCSGDCDICGCSLERRAAHTCCCSQRKLSEQAHQPDRHKEKDDCSKAILLTCGRTCGDGESLSLDGSEKFELLPAQNQALLPTLDESGNMQHPPLSLADRRDEPPDPLPEYLKPA
jgi:hypothetical protein